MRDYIGIANKWRVQKDMSGKGGVIVLYHNDVQGWVNELRNPEHWRPGCIAVDEHGDQWEAIDGNDYDGAKEWKSFN